MFSWDRLRALGGFGLRVFGTRIVFYLERNVDTVLVARFLGPASTGLYTLSYNVMLVPLEQIGGPMAEVLFPAFSKMQDDFARLRAAWLRAVRVLAAIVAPAMALLIALAPDIIPVVFGEKWKSAVPIVQLLAFVGLQQSLMRFNSSVLQAVGRADFLLRYALISATVCIAGFAVGLHWGVTGVAAGYTITATLVAAGLPAFHDPGDRHARARVRRERRRHPRRRRHRRGCSRRSRGSGSRPPCRRRRCASS